MSAQLECYLLLRRTPLHGAPARRAQPGIMGKKRKTNNKAKDASSKKSKKQSTPRAPSAAPAASPSGGMSDTLLKMKFMQKASPAPAAAPAAAPRVVAEPPERKLFGRRSFGGFNREIERNEASFYRAHGLRYDVMPAAEKPAAALDFGAYSQGRRKDKKR